MGSCLPVLYAGKIGIRPILVIGHFAMSVSMFFCGFFVLYEWNVASFVMIVVFIFTYHFSTGSFAWVYIPEVCVDAASGFAMSGQFIVVVLLSFTFEFMINSGLKVYGSLWVFSAITMVGFIFVICVIKEIVGLSDLEKKSLYMSNKVRTVETELKTVN